PTWDKLNTYFTEYRTTHDFHLAKVDCTIQIGTLALGGYTALLTNHAFNRCTTDLCIERGVSRYPTIKLYHSGQEVDDYTSSDFSFETMLAYIESNAAKYLPIAPPRLRETPNPDGLVVLLTADTFRKEFYAPWCSHCKRFAPTWEKLGAKLRGRVNVGMVDCIAHKGGFKGGWVVRIFPTLKFFSDGKIVDFKLPRTMDKLLEFVEEEAGRFERDTGSTWVATDLARLEWEKEVLLIYVYDERSPPENLVSGWV
ncbi:thioredoxin-like protein, partial [Jimgerdemannia flammicorona]